MQQYSINTFRELFNEIVYSWDYNSDSFIKHENGTYSLNKLLIGPDFIHYKTDTSSLDPKVFAKFEQFIDLLKEPQDKFNEKFEEFIK